MNKVVHKYNGKVVTKAELDKLMPRKKLEGPAMTANTYTEHDPLVSEGCGVMKHQVGETREMIRRHNIQGARVRDSGQIEFTSRRARSEYLKRRGLVDNDAGYSD